MSYELIVKHKGKRVGKAAAEQLLEKFSFEYDPEWLKWSESFPLSQNIPQESSRWSASRSHPYFANLLPEGHARQVYCDRYNVNFNDDLGLLRELGTDTAGAFEITPADNNPDIGKEETSVPLKQIKKWAYGESELNSEQWESPRSSLAGEQPKAAVVLTDSGYAFPPPGEPTTHILKFESKNNPSLPANEYLITRFAAALGLEVVDSELDSRTRRPSHVIRRYDRQDQGDSIERIHQEDICQILGLMPSKKYAGNGGPSNEDIAEVIQHHSCQPDTDLERFTRWVIFSAISGNINAHAKDLSLVYAPDGLKLAPFYDLVCTEAGEHLEPKLATAVGGERRTDRLSRKNWERFAADIGVTTEFVLSEVNRMLESADLALEKATTELHEEVSDPPILQNILQIINNRGRHLKQNL